MDAQNLAVCLAPSLFALSNPIPKVYPSNSLVRRASFRRTTVNSGRTHMNIATSKEVNESVVSLTSTVVYTPSSSRVSATLAGCTGGGWGWGWFYVGFR